MRRFLMAIVSLAALPAIASAQRGGMAGMGHPAASAPHASIAPHAAPASAARISSGARTASSTNYGVRPPSGMHWVRTRSGAIVARPIPRTTTPVQRAGSGRALLSQDTVPGLGFDYAHVAAVHPNGIHGHDHNRRNNSAFFPLFFGGGYDLPIYPDDVDDAPAADTQAADNSQSEPPQPALRPGDYDSRQNRPPAPSRDVIAEQQPEPYVFVRLDGTLFFATAYAWENGTLRYITAEGLRHTVNADKLDLNATQQFNEQRGLSFRVPAA